jgi:hypothetical protein
VLSAEGHKWAASNVRHPLENRASPGHLAISEGSKMFFQIHNDACFLLVLLAYNIRTPYNLEEIELLMYFTHSIAYIQNAF